MVFLIRPLRKIYQTECGFSLTRVFSYIDSIFNSVLLQKVRIRENLYAGIFYIVVLELNFLLFVVVGEKLEKKKKKRFTITVALLTKAALVSVHAQYLKVGSHPEIKKYKER